MRWLVAIVHYGGRLQGPAVVHCGGGPLQGAAFVAGDRGQRWGPAVTPGGSGQCGVACGGG